MEDNSSLNVGKSPLNKRPRRSTAGILPARYKDTTAVNQFGQNTSNHACQEDIQTRSFIPSFNCQSDSSVEIQSQEETPLERTVRAAVTIEYDSNNELLQDNQDFQTNTPIDTNESTSQNDPANILIGNNVEEESVCHVIFDVAGSSTSNSDFHERLNVTQICDRNLLDSSDKRLHTACTTRGIPFEWPDSDTGRSIDESEERRERRRKNLRKLLEINGRLRRNNVTRYGQNLNPHIREVGNENSRVALNLRQNNIFLNNNLDTRIVDERFHARYAQDVLQCNQIIEENSIGYKVSATNAPLKECRYCGALLWELELSSMCCSNGKVKLSVFPNPPALIKQLWESNSEEACIYREYSRFLNNAFAMASQKVNEFRPPGGGYSPTVVIQGKVHTFIGPLRPSPGTTPKFAQIWVHDPDQVNEAEIRLQNMRLPTGTSERKRYILLSLLTRLQEVLRINPYIRDFKTACEIPENEVTHCLLVLNSSARPQNGHSRIYNKNLIEIAVLLNEEPGSRDLVLQLRDGGIKEIVDTHRSSDSLHFVLTHPLGHDGWHVQLKHVDPHVRNENGDPVTTNSRLTVREFYSFHLHERRTSENCLHRMHRLFQEYVCVQCAKYEIQKLYWLRTNQSKIRADLYNNVCDAIHMLDSSRMQLGRSVILSPSFTGGPRAMHRRFQDGMAIIRHYHKPDLFITFTCNPNWTEIQETLLQGQKAHDRPDIVARVFRLKLKALMHDLTKSKVFGECAVFLYVVEFQKRGLPHAHILLVLNNEYRVRTAEHVDDIVCAELPPDPKSFPPGSTMEKQASNLETIILKQMRHGPCGPLNSNAPCMLDKMGNKSVLCQKHFPKSYQQSTFWDDNKTYPTYRRRSPEDYGRTINTPTGLVDNGWIVPYSPYLCLKYNAHINVEVRM